MKCDEKYLEAYINKELTENQTRELDAHLSNCSNCMRQFKEVSNLNECLTAYQTSQAENSFLFSLINISQREKVKFSIFHLFPKEFAFSVLSILLALYIGVFFSIQTLNQNVNNQQTQDYFEQISLASLVDYK